MCVWRLHVVCVCLSAVSAAHPWSSFSALRTISGPTRIVMRSAPPLSPLSVARCLFRPFAASGVARAARYKSSILSRPCGWGESIRSPGHTVGLA